MLLLLFSVALGIVCVLLVSVALGIVCEVLHAVAFGFVCVVARLDIQLQIMALLMGL